MWMHPSKKGVLITVSEGMEHRFERSLQVNVHMRSTQAEKASMETAGHQERIQIPADTAKVGTLPL